MKLLEINMKLLVNNRRLPTWLSMTNFLDYIKSCDLKEITDKLDFTEIKNLLCERKYSETKEMTGYEKILFNENIQ